MKLRFAFCDPKSNCPKFKDYVRNLDPEIECISFQRLTLLMQAFRLGEYFDFIFLDLGNEEIEVCSEIHSVYEDIFIIYLAAKHTKESSKLVSKVMGNGAIQSIFSPSEKEFISQMRQLLDKWKKMERYLDKVRCFRWDNLGGTYINVHFAVIDDEEMCRKQLQGYIDNLEYETTCGLFSSGEEFLAKTDFELVYDIILMDIEMAGINGVELARQIKEKAPEAIIIYVTGYPQYITNAMETEPAQILLKPVNEILFRTTIKRVISKRREHLLGDIGYTKIVFESVGTCCTQKEIIFIEVLLDKITIHTTFGELSFTGRMKEQEERFAKYSFIKTHRSFLVNPFHIRSIHTKNVVLDTGKEVPVSKKMHNDVNKQYLQFLTRYEI